jgi:DNA replication protein DnaC
MRKKTRIRLNPETADLGELLGYLGLRITAAGADGLISESLKNNWSHLKFLETLVSREAAGKRERSIAACVAQAGFPAIKTIDAFDFTFPKSVPRDQLLAAMALRFIEANEGFVFLGEPGTGKTHLAISIGYGACLGGYSVRYTTAIDMINDLQAAQAGHQLRKTMGAYKRPELLIIDEVGYLPFDDKGSNLFFQVISARYETGSTILTTNLPFSKWGETFANNTVAAAIVDRLSHHNELIRIIGDSYRVFKNKQSKK